MKYLIPIAAMIATLLPGSVQAQGITNLTVNGNDVSAEISLAGGIGAEIELEFDQAVGLTTSSIGISAALVNPINTSLLSRLTGGTSISIPTGFPVLLTIEPPSSGALSFSGTYTLELHTTDLSYAADLRLFSGPVGGTLQDVTTTMGAGSYRARTRKGTFSDFLIVIDQRSPATVSGIKLTRIEDFLEDNSSEIDSTVYDTLEDLLADVRDHYDDEDYLDAITDLESFIEEVEDNSGADIPDVWRSARDLDNIAGDLIGYAQTLRFSLLLAAP